MARKSKLLSVLVLVLLALSACGEESETDKSCEKARQMYKDMKDSVENPDSDGDGTVSVSEQAVFDGTKEILLDNLDDFVAGWYEMDGCDLDSGADSTSATTPATTESKRIVNGFTIEPGADLSGADLYGANLSRANLSRANLDSVNLDYTNLTDANLTDAILYPTGIRRPNLSGATMPDGTKNP